MKTNTITECEADGGYDRVFGSSAFTDVIFARNRNRNDDRNDDRDRNNNGDRNSNSDRNGNSNRGTDATRPAPHAGDIVISVTAADITPSQSLRMVGECEALGCWNPERAPELDDSAFPVWSIALPASSLPEHFEYKFIVIDRTTGALMAWEDGCNRTFGYAHPSPSEALRVCVKPFSNPLRWRGSGTAVPVFSLRSERSCGTGEFSDLKLLADWAAATGQSVIQILPVNDTTCSRTWRDSYPYNAVSIFALHPHYVSLRDADIPLDDAERSRFEERARLLNSLPEVDYERVDEFKHEYLRLLYERRGAAALASKDYADFFAANAVWLRPYAVYCVLRDRFGTADFSRWGDMSVFDAAAAERFDAEHAAETGYWYFVQYLLDRQLRDARNYARARGVILKGDIPIGISRTSVEAWVTPELFHMNSCAGAPPDDFAVKGQNWGFPTYDWQRMAADDYAWWRARFVKMSDYFDAYRIDHILGFFRIWEIPRKAPSALLGHFSPARPLSAADIAAAGFAFDASVHTMPADNAEDVLFVADPYAYGCYHPRIAAHSTPQYSRLEARDREAFNALYEEYYYRRHNEWWGREGARKLEPLISSTRMLVCGEDLGMIPACVPDVMSRLRILSLEIERMPKQFGVEFGNPCDYPYYSVCSPSTHDMSNIRLWWSEDAVRREHYYHDVLGRVGSAPEECTAEICAAIVGRQLAAASVLTVVPLQDWLSVSETLRRDDAAAERINDPSNPDQNWNYRMHITLETLLAADDVNYGIRSLLQRYDRAH